MCVCVCVLSALSSFHIARALPHIKGVLPMELAEEIASLSRRVSIRCDLDGESEVCVCVYVCVCLYVWVCVCVYVYVFV